MRTVAGLLPLGLGLAVFAAVTWYLVERDIVIGLWLVAAFLVGHGLVHLGFAAPPPAAARTAGRSAMEYPFDLGRSWLVGVVHLDPRAVRGIGLTLTVLVVLGYVLAGMSTLGLLVPAGWWPVLVIGSTLASLGLLVLQLAPGLVLGVAIDICLLWLALVAAWRP